MQRLLYLLPVALFLIVALFFARGLTLDPNIIPTALIDKPVPEMDLPPLPGRGETGLATADLQGEVALVNVFGSWCVACLAEHPQLAAIKAENVVPIHGLNWLNGRSVQEQVDWLARHGDPYTRIGIDSDESRARLQWGVTGAPETFVIDRQGRIRYKHIGPITPEVWTQTIRPMVRELQQ